MYVLSVEEYMRIGASDKILDWLHNGVELPFSTEPLPCFNHNRIFSDVHACFVDTELQRLLKIGAIEQVNQRPHCVLSMRVVPKKNNKSRLVTDCRHVNLNIITPSFTQEGITAVAECIQKDDILMTIDVKDGFHHIVIKQSFRKYLGIFWRNKYYVWRTLCFGVSIAPYYFNKILRPVIAFICSQNVRIAPFIDDLCLMMSKSEAMVHSQFVLNTLSSLGWTPNYEKCDLTFTHQTIFVGFDISSDKEQGPWIKILPQKVQKLKRAIISLLHKENNCTTARSLVRVVGQCISMAKAIVPGKLLLCNVYRVLSTRLNWDSNVTLTPPALKDLRWWLGALSSWNGAPLYCTPVDIQIATDASAVGWGYYIINQDIPDNQWQGAGWWPETTSCMHLNFREMLAVLKTILSLYSTIGGKHIQILSDNVTTVAYINNLGGSSPDLLPLMTTIWTITDHGNIKLSARYLARKLNF